MNESLSYFFQQIINGLTVGSTYSLIAIGYTLVYGIIGMINFAHGEVYMLSVYITFVVITGLTLLGFENLFFILVAALIISMLVAGAYGFTIEKVAYRPVRQSKRLIALISAIGMSIFLQNYIRLAQSPRDLALPSQISGSWKLGTESFSLNLSYMQFVIFAVTFVAMTGLSLFISRSRLGRACRACAQDAGMTSLLGINTNRVISVTFILGAMLAAVAGVLLGLYYGIANPMLGFVAGLKAFTAAVLGGIGSIPGAVLGGLILGVAETLTGAYFSAQYKEVVAFSLLCLILLFRPSGLLGKPEVEKI